MNGAGMNGAKPIILGIVGSRRRAGGADRAAVAAVIRALPPGSEIVTGGAGGVDSIAEAEARAAGLAVRVLRPDYDGAATRFAAADACYARNGRIVAAVDAVVALPAPDRRGGTEDTIRRAKACGKPVYVALPGDDWPTEETRGGRLRRATGGGGTPFLRNPAGPLFGGA